jgi:hypothetical protein
VQPRRTGFLRVPHTLRRVVAVTLHQLEEDPRYVPSDSEIPFRKAYLRSLIDAVEVGDRVIRIMA